MDPDNQATHRIATTERGPRCAMRGRGFSITELLVVIGIIVLLAGLLIVALGEVRSNALATRTLSTMNNFSAACDAFFMEHNRYPGVIPEETLAEANTEGWVRATFGGSGDTTLSGTENALLELMGGLRICHSSIPGCSGFGTTEDSPTAAEYRDFEQTHAFEIGQPGQPVWSMKVNMNRMGEGTYINGKLYAPYFTPSANELGVAPGQVLQSDSTSPDDWIQIPDLLDAWGQPIIFARRVRSAGPLVGERSDRPQFLMGGMMPYLEASTNGGSNTGLGEMGTEPGQRSILTRGSTAEQQARFAQIIRHPSFGSWTDDPLAPENIGRVVPRGEYVLISAGPDGIYFSEDDGPGTPGSPIPSASEDILPPSDYSNAQVIETYNDIVIFGGG